MNKSYLLPALSALSLGVSTSVAAVEEGQWYFSPNLSYVISDDDRHADDEFGLQLGVGQVINQSWNIELSVVMDTLELENGVSEFKQRGLQFDGLYFFDRDRNLDLYLVAGIGGLQTRFANDKNTNMMANVGAGVMHMINDGISLRTDLRYRFDDDDSSMTSENRFGDWVVNLGLMIPFGGSKAAPAAAPVAAVMPAPEPVVLDTDADGVTDSMDRCANTISGAKVDASGCELDGDKDGVVDRLDTCPSSAAGVKVDAKGCEQDSDHDGILDSADSCPGSVANAKVDMKGCEIAEVIVLKGVNFNSGSTELTDGSKVILDGVAQTLKKNVGLVVELAGYTDNTGSKALNVSLSQRRAQSVVNFLVSRGVNRDNLIAKGYGPDSPIADNSTVEGRAENRRVEMHIVE